MDLTEFPKKAKWLTGAEKFYEAIVVRLKENAKLDPSCGSVAAGS
jgi:hypothetical protein